MNSALEKQKRKLNYPALGFLFPFAGMLLVMLFCRFEPFGKYSMLYSDMYHQYYPFFKAFRSALRSGESLLYNWNVGLGMDYLGLISYYLASPLNLLSVLVPEKWLLEFFSLLMPVKLGLAGLFFSLFLRGVFDRDDFSLSVFGGFYGLCAWALGYQWNIMWLDTFALLPLVALGTVKLIKEKKFILYTLTLFLSVYSNYYIGFFICIFVFLLFFAVEICRFRGFKPFFLDLCRIAFFSVLAIGMTAILEFPTLAALQTTQSSVNKFPKDFRLNMTTDHTIKGLFGVMKKVTGNLGGGLEPTFKEGLPNLYCGVGSLLLAVLYMMANKVKLRDKICAFLMLLFFQLSFIIRQLDYIWHGFHFTNMIPYRFSFLYSFVLLYMAYRAWTLRHSFGIFKILLAGLITGALLSCSEELLEMQTITLGSLSFDAPLYIIYNGCFLLLYMGIFLFSRIHRRIPPDAEEEVRLAEEKSLCLRRMYLRAGALGVCVAEIAAMLLNFSYWFNGTNVENYPRGTEETASMIRYMKEREQYQPFFRAETTHSQTLNDGALNDYYGVSTFTSSANVHVTEFMKALGYGAKNTYNRYCFEESSPAANLFLGLKYMLERQGRDRSSTYFTDVHHYGKVHLLQNNFYLPLGFLAESGLENLDFRLEGDRFQFQDRLLAAASGLDRPVFHILPPETRSVSSDKVVTDGVTQEGKCSYHDAEKGGNITFTFTPDQAGFLCIHLNFPKRNSYSVRINDVEQYQEKISLPQMLAVGDVQPGDLVEIIIKVKEGEKSSVTAEAAVLLENRFRESYQVLAESPLNLTVFKPTYLEGSISCSRDGLLYTSIPQNGNWHAYVDGEKRDTVLVGDAMLGVHLTKGDHVIEFRYRNPAFTIGAAVSLTAFSIFLLAVCMEKKKLRKHGKFQK